MTDIIKTTNINGHEVSHFYAGLTVYVVDGKHYYAEVDAAKACGLTWEEFDEAY